MKRQIVGSLVGWLLAFTFMAIFPFYQVVGNGMQNTLNDGQYILVNKIAYLLHGPERGDIVDFHDPTNAKQEWIKRVIGLPGDTVTLDRRGVSINGVQLIEPYVNADYNTLIETVKVPPDEYFVLGDNRGVSKDSRFFGFVPRKDIVGRVIVVRTLLEIGFGLGIGAMLCLSLVVWYRKRKRSRLIQSISGSEHV